MHPTQPLGVSWGDFLFCWLRLLSMSQYRLTYKCYCFQYNEAEMNKSCWAHDVKRLLFSTGMGEAWFNQGVGCFSTFINMFKQRCQDINIQEWQSAMQLYPKLDTYRQFKLTFGLSSHLSVVEKESFRNALTRFRVSAHCLRIESDRHLQIDRAERICTCCNNTDIENEYHFCLICPLYNELRRKYIPKYYYTFPTFDKFTSLLQSNSSSVLQNLAKYIHFSMNARTEWLQT